MLRNLERISRENYEIFVFKKMPKTLDITRILREQTEQLRAGFQDRLVMTASIPLRIWNCLSTEIIRYSIVLEILLEMRFCAAFGVLKKSGVTRLFKVFASAMLANFQDRLVMTASITLRVCYLIVFFRVVRNIVRHSFARGFHCPKNGVFSTSFGALLRASSRGNLKFQSR